MSERAIAAFLLTFIGLSLLLGPAESGRDFLAAVVVASVVGLVVAVWLRPSERPVEEGFFDERAMRRAVSHGVIRTALAAVLPLAVLAIVVWILSSVWQTRGDRREHFEDVAGYGFFAAHPGFEPVNLHGDLSSVSFRSLELPVQAMPRNASPLAEAETVELRLDLRGRLDADALRDLPRTGVDEALVSPPLTREQLRALERTSDFLVASAAVELRDPLSAADLQRLLARHDLLAGPSEGVAVFLEPPEGFRPEPFRYRRVSWPTPALAQFQAWAKKLHQSDDAALERLGLPPARELLELAAEPYVHAFAFDSATPRQLRELSVEPAVRTIAIGDVSFDFGGAGG